MEARSNGAPEVLRIEEDRLVTKNPRTEAALCAHQPKRAAALRTR
jgi:hypothetical protein